MPDYRIESLLNLRQKMRSLMVCDDKKKIPYDAACTQPRRQLLDHRVFRCALHGGVREHLAQVPGLRVRRAKIRQLLFHGLSGGLFQRDVRQRCRVLQAGGLQFGLPCRFCIKLLIIASCTAGVICLATSDSAPSTAIRAANSFNSTRAARSAASISALAAARTFSTSSCVTPRSRSSSAAASRCACARNSATSRSRLPILVTASCNLRSASALAAVALLMASLM